MPKSNRREVNVSRAGRAKIDKYIRERGCVDAWWAIPHNPKRRSKLTASLPLPNGNRDDLLDT